MLYENFRQVNDRRTDQDRQDRPKQSGHQLTVVSGVATPEKSILEFIPRDLTIAIEKRLR
jgi:hypothetical protein